MYDRVVRYLSISIIILLFDLGHAKPKNQFIGEWTLDFHRTLQENPLLSESKNSDLFTGINLPLKVVFSIEGGFEEHISKSTLSGTWSRYDDHLAVVRLESDKNVILERNRYKNRIDNSPNRYQKTRDYQRLYWLNRLSVRKYHYLDGHVSQEIDLGDRVIRVFLKRISP